MFFTLLSAIFFEFPITRTPDNSNLFSISLEGSSYRESTVPGNARGGARERVENGERTGSGIFFSFSRSQTPHGQCNVTIAVVCGGDKCHL